MTDETTDDDPNTDVGIAALDMVSIEADIADGVKAYGRLMRHASDDWNSWAITIRGLRALRNLAFAQARTSDIKSYAYREALGGLLRQRKYSVLDNIDKQTRSTCYKLMDGIDEISEWYASLSPSDQLRWKHPDSIAKHCPRHLLTGGSGHNKPKPKAKKLFTTAEAERLKALLIQVIKRLAKYEPDALEMLDQLVAPGDPDDSTEDLWPDAQVQGGDK